MTNNYFMIPLMSSQIHRYRKLTSGCQELEGGGLEELMLNGDRVLDKKCPVDG